MRCDVIVTYCWNRVGYNILRSLASKGLNVWVADTSTYNICSLSNYCSGKFVYPDPFTKEDEFIECLVGKIEELKPRVLIPTHDESLVIMRNCHRFPKDLIIPYDNVEKLLMLSNKALATQIAKNVGVPIPKVYNSPDDVKYFPCVFKTVIGNSAKGVYFPKNRNELETLLERHKNTDTLIEEIIGGSDYSVDCIRWNGFWKSSVYHALVTKTDGGGTTTQREIVEFPELIGYAKRILDKVDYQGVCGIDFRYDPITKKIAFIEVNARFTGGIATPIAAGFDIPIVLYSLATEGQYNKMIDLRTGTKTKWILGDFITLVGRAISFNFNKKEWMQIMKFRGFDNFDDFYSDDYKAFFGEMSYYLIKLIKNGKLNP